VRLPHLTRTQAGRLFLLATATGWGLNWPVLKLVLQDWPPLFARGVAGLIAASGLGLLAYGRGERLTVPRALFGRLGLAAAINVFAWMGFTGLSLRWLTVPEGALLAYSMPVWAVLLAWVLRGERPDQRGFAALALGILGICVLVDGTGTGLILRKAPGIALALAAAILFALGTILERRPIGLPPIALTAWQVGLGCLAMTLISLFTEASDIKGLSLPSLAGISYMAIGPLALCYLSWQAALRRLPTSMATTGMLLVPIIGTAAAALVLHETIGSRQMLAFVLTLSGVGLALQRKVVPTSPTACASSSAGLVR
jgi:drug/metabolite transporter (DMT)-like permease